MILFSELQLKEFIQVETGERLGFVHDLEICSQSGKVISFVLLDDKMNRFFKKGDERVIYWEQVVVIGLDVVLVKDPC